MPELENAAEVLTKALLDAETVVVFTGAGISTSCGIPDFRGEHGVYATVKERYHLPTPESIFEIDYFKTNPEPFFDFSRVLFTEEIHPSSGHKFLAWLETLGKRVSIVTQNIDMLHGRAGSSEVVPCHGTYRSAHCLDCGKLSHLPEYEQALHAGTVPRCGCGGIIKPDIVFFGEKLPDEFFRIYTCPPAADVLLVLGSSLLVQPAAQYPLRVMQHSPGILSALVNNTPTPFDDYFTLTLHKDIDSFLTTIRFLMEEALEKV